MAQPPPGPAIKLDFDSDISFINAPLSVNIPPRMASAPRLWVNNHEGNPNASEGFRDPEAVESFLDFLNAFSNHCHVVLCTVLIGPSMPNTYPITTSSGIILPPQPTFLSVAINRYGRFALARQVAALRHLEEKGAAFGFSLGDIKGMLVISMINIHDLFYRGQQCRENREYLRDCFQGTDLLPYNRLLTKVLDVYQVHVMKEPLEE